ncbi:MAG TPA: hypothetical protein VF035_00560 [Longimicrobiales bacterium]
MRKTGKAAVLAGLFCMALLAVPRSVRAQAVAIVVHPNVKATNVSFDELQRIFKAEQQFWPDGSRITLLVRAPVAMERNVVLNRIYRMSEDQFRQFWIAKMFRADVAAGPKIVYSTESARDLVVAIPGAITFLPVDAVTPGMRVLRIDGALPTDARYPLRAR